LLPFLAVLNDPDIAATAHVELVKILWSGGRINTDTLLSPRRSDKTFTISRHSASYFVVLFELKLEFPVRKSPLTETNASLTSIFPCSEVSTGSLAGFGGTLLIFRSAKFPRFFELKLF
jgi:hypothetical protein